MFPSVRDVIEIVLCHRRKAIAFLVLSLAATWLVLAAWPRTYRSEAVLLVRVGRESVALDPTATMSQTLMLQKTQSNEINSALNILNSQQVAAKAVDAVGPAKVLGYESLEAPTGAAGESLLSSSIDAVRDLIDSALWTAQLKDPVSDRELAIMRLQGTLSAFAPKDSTVITVRCTAKTPQLAQRLVEEVTGAFLLQRIASTRSAGSRAFFEEKVHSIGEKLNTKAEEIAAYRQSHNIISISASREVLKGRVAGLEQDLVTARSKLWQAKSEVDELTSKISTVEPEIVQAKTAATDSTWSAMRQALYNLQLEEKHLSQQVTGEHPKLIALRQQLKEAEVILAKQRQESVNQTTAPNPVRTKLINDLMSVQTQVVGLESQVRSLEQQREEANRQLNDLVGHEATLARLEREHELLEADYRRHANKQQEAHAIEQLEEQRISNINVFQPATFSEKPVSPRKKIVAAGGMLFALTGAVFVALVAEASRSTLRTSEHAESKLGVPVLVAIPEQKKIGSVLDCLTLEGELRDMRTACRSLLRQLLAGSSRKSAPPQTIGVLSCQAGAGGSTIAALLASAATGDFGMKAVLVDADDREPRVGPRSTEFSHHSDTLGHYFDDDHREAESASHAESGTAPHADGETPVVNARFVNPQSVFNEVRRLAPDHDLVIVDLPPADSSSSGASLASMMDCVVLVIEADATDARTALRVRSQLERSQARLEGVVLNKTKRRLFD